MGNHRLEEVEEEKDLGSADPPNTISQQQLCCGGQESEPGGRTHLQNCDTHERTNCCTTVQISSETTSGVLLTSLVWSPYLKKDILSIGKVQRRVTKMIPSISALTYEERLKRTGLISLENRRLRPDLLEVFKILKGFVKVDPATRFSMSDRRSRGQTLKLEKPRARFWN